MAIQDGVGRLTWATDSFAYADYYDATADRYPGLEAGQRPTVQLNATSVVVKPEIAQAQLEKDRTPANSAAPTSTAGEGEGPQSNSGDRGASVTTGETGKGTDTVTKPKVTVLRRFHGSSKVDATRLSRDVDLIASSVVQHLVGLLGTKVTITIEIEAEIPSGAPDNVVRTVTENCRTLKFETSGFEED